MDIRKIIREESITMYFQPIVSTNKKKISGYEALVRGRDNETGDIINPFVLFEEANKYDLVIELDRLCQKKAMELFREKFSAKPDTILFLNVDNSVIHMSKDIDEIYNMAIENSIMPENIVLEINEVHSVDMVSVKKFTQFYKEKGFMISIDDIGAGYSNFDRVILLEPDIIKIDKDLISDIDSSFYKQQIVSMIINLSERVGSLVVAEGTEKIEEVLFVIKYGVQFIQGFYFSKPEDINEAHIAMVDKKINKITKMQKNILNEIIINKNKNNLMIKDIFNTIKSKIKDSYNFNCDDYLKNIICNYDEIECIYVVDIKGTQISNTVFKKDIGDISKKKIFNPYKKYDDVTLRDYYYNLLTTEQRIYISSKYLSMATGNKCRTISGFVEIGSIEYILCLDINL